MWTSIFSQNRASWMLFLLLLCCSGRTCERQELKPSPASSLQTVQSFHDEINVPQAYPEEERASLPVFTMDYPRIQVPFEFTLWVLLASFAKMGFHIYHKITIWIPESCLLIAIGLIVGAIMHSVKEEPPAVLNSDVFFLYMLPPIVLDNGYFMPTRPFFENVGTVLWYAVVGTLWNSVGIGLSLFAICQIEAFGVQDINLQENLLFASIISAVDPVAALNVFEDIGVNEQIYIVIFGEGLFNDAVTVKVSLSSPGRLQNNNNQHVASHKHAGTRSDDSDGNGGLNGSRFLTALEWKNLLDGTRLNPAQRKHCKSSRNSAM